MEINPQTSKNIKIVNKKKSSIKPLLNVYGVIAFLSLVTSIITIPVSVNENLEIIYREDLIMKQEKILEFLLFNLTASILYFSAINIYFIKRK